MIGRRGYLGYLGGFGLERSRLDGYSDWKGIDDGDSLRGLEWLMNEGMLEWQMGGVAYIGYWLVLEKTIWKLRLVKAQDEELVERMVFWVSQPFEG